VYLPSIGTYLQPCLWQSGEVFKSKAPYHPEGKPVESREASIGPDLHTLCDMLAAYIIEYPDARFVLRNIVKGIEHDTLKKHIDELLLRNVGYPK
jgi:hypothetical protein